MWRYLLSLVIFLTTIPAFACENGDREVGPVCVHEESVEGRLVMVSTVYNETIENVVWKDVGEVRKASKEELVVYTMTLTDDGMRWTEVTFQWSPEKGKYVSR